MHDLTHLINLSDRTAVVTGGGGHIGQEYCRLFAELGGRCIILDHDNEKIEATLNRLPSLEKGQHIGRVVDIGDIDDLTSVINWVISDIKEVDVLVNNAAFTGDSALNGWVTDFKSQTIEAWNAALHVNLTACFKLSQGLAPILAKSKKGCIVNVASIYGVLGPDLALYENTQMGNPAAYAASKGGLIQLTRWLATVLAPEVRVNCVSPGGLARNQCSTFVERYNAKVPLGRMGSELDIARALLFFSCQMSDYVTGQNLLVDGGFSAW
jgi:NAD(P)-dependent dehydrogenase (short-subunit alcohol dehydrogenase family)